ncbi:MAG: hypothetical protein A4E29_00704 [Methanomassiliicoccales archaeon PtaB.Bin134]|nr:MAG: hypothetical protein A4E29_00704 [Methanomassiliicoccales archaeon PtaB.Bin134]
MNAPNIPALRPNAALPSRNTGTTVRAPQTAVENTRVRPTASLTANPVMVLRSMPTTATDQS